MAAYVILSKFLPDDIINRIFKFNFPRKRWIRYWKNQAMSLIEGGRMLRLSPHMITNMNNIYLDNLTYDVLDNHIGILEEISHMCENVVDADFNILMDAIRHNIRTSLRLTIQKVKK